MKKPMIKALACSLAFTLALSTPVAVSAEGIANVYSETQKSENDTNTNTNTDTNSSAEAIEQEDYSKVIGLVVNPESATVEVGNEIRLEASILVDMDAEKDAGAFRPMALNELEDDMVIVFEGKEMLVGELKGKLTWYEESENNNVKVTNNNDGTATVSGIEKGNATVNVKLGDVYKASASIKVKKYATTLAFKADAPKTGYLKHNCMNLYDFIEYDGNDEVSFSVYDNKNGKATKNITVASNGQMTFKKTGTYTIKAVTERGVSDTHVITIERGTKATKVETKDAKTVDLEITGEKLNPSKTVSVSLVPTDSTDCVTWTSNKTNIATVVGDGTSATIIAQNPGTAKITAKATNGKKLVFTVKVTAPLQEIKAIVSPKANIYQGQSVQLDVVKVPHNATEKITFKAVSANRAASVNSKGVLKAKAKKTGEVTVTATSKNTKKTATATFKIEASKLTSASITKGDITLYRGKNFEFTANLNDEATEDMVTWSTSKAKVATVDQVFGSAQGASKALASAYTKGTAKIKVSGVNAKGKKVSDTVKVTVKQPVTSIELSKSELTVNPGTKKVTLKVAKQLPKNANKEKISWAIVEDSVGGCTLSKAEGTSVKVNVPREAKLGGVVKVKATAASGAWKIATITVCNKTKNVSVDKKSVTVDAGAKLVIGTDVTFTVNAKDSKADTAFNEKIVSYTANNNNVRIEGDTIYVLKAGTSKVTAKTASGKKATVTIKAK